MGKKTGRKAAFFSQSLKFVEKNIFSDGCTPAEDSFPQPDTEVDSGHQFYWKKIAAFPKK
ncbi:hypothetical protein [Weizmannia acidilactici]|uniref:hypothetical protein n=1 Tax=Weizmannia acidilactici TaxID=2607726 RepID=UPI00124C7510|nr:hypothetical protein [Weizmannia acidilactici]